MSCRKLPAIGSILWLVRYLSRGVETADDRSFNYQLIKDHLQEIRFLPSSLFKFSSLLLQSGVCFHYNPLSNAETQGKISNTLGTC